MIHTGSPKVKDKEHPCDSDQKHWFKTSTYNYITDEVFKNADDDRDEAQIASSLDTNISPLHKAMLLSGCYGNYHKIRHSYSALNALEAAWFRNLVHGKNTSFVMNIMLQHLENTESLTSTRAPAPAGEVLAPLNASAYKVSRDRGVCACMKDFATPYIVKQNTGGTQDTESYDTCLAQNLQDYTFNAAETLTYDNDFKAAKNGETWDAAYTVDITFANRMLGLDNMPVQRNRKDPVSKEIEDYFNEIATVIDPTLTTQTGRDGKLASLLMNAGGQANAIAGYNEALFMNLVNTLITSTIWDHKDEVTGELTVATYLLVFLPGFTHIQSLNLRTVDNIQPYDAVVWTSANRYGV